MGAIATFPVDRRALHAVVNAPRTLDYLNDVDALAQDVPSHVNKAWDAMNRGDMPTVIVSFNRLIGGAEQQRALVHELCDCIENAPNVPREQIEIWTRASDGAVVSDSGTAA